MSGVHDELARIIDQVLDGIDQDECEHANGWWETSKGVAFGAERKVALKAAVRERVEAEIEWLREERDEWKDTAEEIGGELRRSSELREAAEARCAELERERDAAIEAMHGTSDSRDDWRRWAEQHRDRADALSARCARLQQALDETLKIARRVRGGDNVGEEWYAITEYADKVLREALAGLDTPADSQDCEHDYVYVSRSEDYYRCDKCDQTSKDGVYPRVGNFHPFKPADSQEDKT